MELNAFLIAQVLDVLGFLHLSPLFHGWFREILALAQLTHGLRAIKFSLEAFQRAIYIFSVLNWYYQHSYNLLSFGILSGKDTLFFLSFIKPLKKIQTFGTHVLLRRRFVLLFVDHHFCNDFF